MTGLGNQLYKMSHGNDEGRKLTDAEKLEMVKNRKKTIIPYIHDAKKQLVEWDEEMQDLDRQINQGKADRDSWMWGEG